MSAIYNNWNIWKNKPPEHTKIEKENIVSNANLHIDLSTKNYRDLIGLPREDHEINLGTKWVTVTDLNYFHW